MLSHSKFASLPAIRKILTVQPASTSPYLGWEKGPTRECALPVHYTSTVRLGRITGEAHDPFFEFRYRIKARNERKPSYLFTG